MNVVSLLHGMFKPSAPSYDEPSAMLDPRAFEVETEYVMAQREYYDAQRALRQAEANLDNAVPDYIFLAIEELNIARHRSDVSTRKLKLLLGIEPNGRLVIQ